jgi:hypothetical protein
MTSEYSLSSCEYTVRDKILPHVGGNDIQRQFTGHDRILETRVKITSNRNEREFTFMGVGIADDSAKMQATTASMIVLDSILTGDS